MISQDIYEMLNIIKNDKSIRTSAIIITLLVLFMGIFVNFFAAVVAYISYILGYVIAWYLIKYRSKVTEYLQKLIHFYHERISVKKRKLKHSCSICDDLSCRRHQQTASVTPWKHLHITKDLNEAIEQFYDKIIENFIVSWYGQFTEDTDFVNELRYCLRYASATAISQFLELDIADVIANKLIPCAVKHVDDYLYIQQIAKLKNMKFNDVAVEYLGKRLHAAATNRKNELEYLQHLASLLLNHILPETYVKCRNYSVVLREILAGWVLLPLTDVLADPNIINSLVILAITYKSKKTPKTNQTMDHVEFLENYVITNKKVSSFSTNLNKIKNNTELLYAFMQFLKKQEHVNLLQFCLDVDDFNIKLLTPDLSKKQLEELHFEALKLYKDYLDKESLNFIGCPNDISDDFNCLVKDYCIEKLSELSKLLYTAYEYTFNILESVWLPQFFHSNEFYNYICGSKVSTNYIKPHRSKRYYESSNLGTVAKISSGLGKIKGVLKTSQPIEGAFYPMESQNVENGTVEDILLAECKTLFRDLSTWKVSIPSYQASPSNKVIYFCINIERLDILSEDSKGSWVVLRKDQDFYTLKAKLVEFHGESEICDSPLPSRKAGSSIDTRMLKYDDFLKKLLRKPTLRGSDLLYSFLTTEEDFSIFIATNASNIQDIGNIYQSVAHKLRKEKGQHLDSFMAAFLNSTGRNQNDKVDLAEVGEEFDTLNCNSKCMLFPKTFRNHIFNDNFGVKYKSLKDTMSGSYNPDGFTECVFYLVKQIFKFPNGLLRIYVAICSVAQQIVDLTCRILIERKLKSALSQPNLAYLIKLLQDVIFHPHPSPTKDDLEKRKARAFSELQTVIPPLIKKMFRCDIESGLRILLEILQSPHYNKQLAYNLLDIVLIEMYPTLEKM